MHSYPTPCLPPPPPETRPHPTGRLLDADLHTLENIHHAMVYLWLKNGWEFWSYPLRFDSRYMYAYLWRGNCWHFARVPLTLIRSYH